MKTVKILEIVKFLCWVLFIGCLIQAGAILISYLVSIGNAEAAKDLFLGVNLFDLWTFSFGQYTIAVILMVTVIILKASVAYLAIQLLSKIKLADPFESTIARLVEKISYVVLVIGGVVVLMNIQQQWLHKNNVLTPIQSDPGGILFLAMILFIVAHIFKRGVHIQSENDLTI